MHCFKQGQLRGNDCWFVLSSLSSIMKRCVTPSFNQFQSKCLLSLFGHFEHDGKSSSVSLDAVCQNCHKIMA